MNPDTAFEIFAPAIVDAISYYLSMDPTIVHAKVVCAFPGGLCASPILRDDHHQWSPRPGTPEYMNFFMTLVEAQIESWDQVDQKLVPSLLIADYDVASESLETDFRYDELQPGIPEMKKRSETVWIELWVERYLTTGDQSTGLIVPDDLMTTSDITLRIAEGYPLL